MFGSDYPFWDPLRTFETVERSGFGDELRTALMSGNAQRLFGLGESFSGR